MRRQSITGSRTWEFVVVPEASGAVGVPPLSFSWFDPAAGRIVSAETTPLAVGPGLDQEPALPDVHHTPRREPSASGKPVSDPVGLPSKVGSGEGPQEVDRWSEPADFHSVPSGTSGSSGRNVLRCPDWQGLDLSLQKAFPVGRMRLTMRWAPSIGRSPAVPAFLSHADSLNPGGGFVRLSG